MALTPEIKAQLNQYLVNLKSNVVIEAFVDESESSTNMSELLIELTEMSEKIVLNVHKDKNERTPSFKINRPNESTGIQFAGIPLGHEFSSLVLALLQVGDHPLKISDNLIEQIQKIEGNF
ncbi:MAG: alkyl hydroperoxide reductase subunit F, partial [Nitrosomonadales bacterium]|nr:alkyl hydroperoxide reductase subunit F [Nitrosomonadales bacterium]